MEGISGKRFPTPRVTIESQAWDNLGGPNLNVQNFSGPWAKWAKNFQKRLQVKTEGQLWVAKIVCEEEGADLTKKNGVPP